MRLLGELEERIMTILWRADASMTVREVQAELSSEPALAYTTVMTVMDRLRRKRLLHRRARGRAFEYSPVVSEAEYTAELMHDLLRRTQDRSGALAHFVRGIKKGDEEELFRLAREASRRRAGR